jgi:hypothetical protein
VIFGCIRKMTRELARLGVSWRDLAHLALSGLLANKPSHAKAVKSPNSR